MSVRYDGVPVTIAPGGHAVSLQRVALTDRTIQEGWLQELMFKTPGVLPVEDIDPGFTPLVPVGREIPTAVGPMDNLYISPQGLLTLVEAKLWRNPQARREVVGQILDYAKEISRWSYADLDAKATEAAGKPLWQLVCDATGDILDEGRFVDAVTRNMRAGRFLLLIVGDGIREEMERLAEFLQGTPQLRFTLALVELQVYRLDEGGRLLVMPIVVGRTAEITRAVVRVDSSAGTHVDVSLDISSPENGGVGAKRRTLTRDEFFAQLEESGCSREAVELAKAMCEEYGSDRHFVIDWKASSFVLKLRDPVESSRLYTVLVVEQSGQVYVGWLPDQLSRAGLPSEMGVDFARNLGALLGCMPHQRSPGGWETSAPLSDIAANYEAFKAHVDRLASEVHARRLRAEQKSRLDGCADQPGAT